MSALNPPLRGYEMPWATRMDALHALYRAGDLGIQECARCQGYGYLSGADTREECSQCEGIGFYLSMSPEVAAELRHATEEQAGA